MFSNQKHSVEDPNLAKCTKPEGKTLLKMEEVKALQFG